MGICGFEVDPIKKKVTAHPFNFYILPFANESLNQRFISQVKNKFEIFFRLQLLIF